MALLDNADPDRVPALIDALPAPIRADLEGLDLARRDLSQLSFELILVHGRDDPIIPATESRALAAAVPEGKAALFIVDRLGHVARGLPSAGGARRRPGAGSGPLSGPCRNPLTGSAV
jgi:pimeloyl-ACP methyl ester carboxylesterase